MPIGLHFDYFFFFTFIIKIYILYELRFYIDNTNNCSYPANLTFEYLTSHLVYSKFISTYLWLYLQVWLLLVLPTNINNYYNRIFMLSVTRRKT